MSWRKSATGQTKRWDATPERPRKAPRRSSLEVEEELAEAAALASAISQEGDEPALLDPQTLREDIQLQMLLLEMARAQLVPSDDEDDL